MQKISVSEFSEKSKITKTNSAEESVVSFQSQIPVPLKVAMKKFIQTHPNWDQYRLTQAALAGFLVQNGIDSRPITRLYIENMFSTNSSH